MDLNEQSPNKESKDDQQSSRSSSFNNTFLNLESLSHQLDSLTDLTQQSDDLILSIEKPSFETFDEQSNLNQSSTFSSNFHHTHHWPPSPGILLNEESARNIISSQNHWPPSPGILLNEESARNIISSQRTFDVFPDQQICFDGIPNQHVSFDQFPRSSTPISHNPAQSSHSNSAPGQILTNSSLKEEPARNLAYNQTTSTYPVKEQILSANKQIPFDQIPRSQPGPLHQVHQQNPLLGQKSNQQRAGSEVSKDLFSAALVKMKALQENTEPLKSFKELHSNINYLLNHDIKDINRIIESDEEVFKFVLEEAAGVVKRYNKIIKDLFFFDITYKGLQQLKAVTKKDVSEVQVEILSLKCKLILALQRYLETKIYSDEVTNELIKFKHAVENYKTLVNCFKLKGLSIQTKIKECCVRIFTGIGEIKK